MTKPRKGLDESIQGGRSELEPQPERGPVEQLFHLAWKKIGIAIVIVYAVLEQFFDIDVIDAIYDMLGNLWEST